MGAAGATAADIVAAAEQVSRQLATKLGADVVAAAGTRGRQAALAARSVSVRDNQITQSGVTTVTPSGGESRPAGVIFPGTEWGANRYPQFPKRRKKGYWFNPTLDAAVPEMNTAWAQALDDGDAAWSGTVKTRKSRGNRRR